MWPDVNGLFSDPGGCSPQGGRKQVLFDTSRAGPALATFQDQLYVGWAGTDERPDLAALLHPEAVTSSVAAPKGMPGGFLSVSADGRDVRTGIVWASLPRKGDANDATVPGVLRAFDATTLAELWNSEKCGGGRDRVGDFAKDVAPTIANGKVYLATFSGQVQVYGMNPAEPCRP